MVTGASPLNGCLGLQHFLAANHSNPSQSSNGRGFISWQSWPWPLLILLFSKNPQKSLSSESQEDKDIFFGQGWNSSSNTSCLWGLWEAGFWPQRLKKSEYPSARSQQAFIWHDLWACTAGAGAPSGQLEPQQCRISVWQPLLLPYLAPSLCLFKCKSALDHHWPWVCSHFTGNTGPKRLREMSKVTQLRSRTRTWTQALPPQGQSLSPHGSYEAYIIWWNTFSNLISESIASLKYARFSPQASHSMLTL